MSIWNKIKNWWYDTKDRNQWIRSFNMDFKRSYLNGEFPVLIKVIVRSGHSDFRSQFSRRYLFVSRSGIKLQAMGITDYFVHEKFAGALALVVLSNDRLCRNLLSLGFDTLWVGDHAWKLESFALPYHSNY